MNRMIRAFVVAVGLFCASSAVAADPSGRATGDANVEKARGIFQQGVDLFHEGNFEAALAEFRKAYATAPSYRILYNIAQTSFELHDYVNALKYYEQYLTDGGADIPAARRTQVEEATQRMQARIAYVDIRVNLDGGEVRVDDVLVGTSPLSGPVAVNPGPRRISVSKAGSPAVAQSITAAGGDHINLVLDLPDPTAAKVRARPDGTDLFKRSADRDRTSRTPLIVSLVATGACVATAGVFGWLALRAKSDFDHDLDTFKVPASQLDSDRSRLRKYALVTDVAAGAALVAAGFSLYFVLSRPSDMAPQTAMPRPFVALVPTVGGMSVQGGW